MDDINKVIEWCGLGSDVATALRRAIGADGTEHPRVVGGMKKEEFEEAAFRAQINGNDLTLVQKGQFRLVGRICRVAVGAEATQEMAAERESKAKEAADAHAENLLKAVHAAEAAAKSAAEMATKMATQDDSAKVALKTVVAQGSDAAVKPLSRDELKAHYAEFSRIYKRNDSPPLTERMPKQHRVSGGRFTHNRTNKPLCEAYQRGACQAHPRSPLYCPVNRNAVHQCCKCLSTTCNSVTCAAEPK